MNDEEIRQRFAAWAAQTRNAPEPASEPAARTARPAWRVPESEPARASSQDDSLVEHERAAAAQQWWLDQIDQRIAAAIQAEHQHMINVLVEFCAGERAEVEGALKELRLELLNKMIETLGNIRKAASLFDLPSSDPKTKVMN